jgi:hypothetical protein
MTEPYLDAAPIWKARQLSIIRKKLEIERSQMETEAQLRTQAERLKEAAAEIAERWQRGENRKKWEEETKVQRTLEGTRLSILANIASLFFMEKELPTAEQNHATALLNEPNPRFVAQKAERVAFLRKEIEKSKEFLDSQRSAGVFSAEWIDSEISEFARKQGIPEAVAAAQRKAEEKRGLAAQANNEGHFKIEALEVSNLIECPRCGETCAPTVWRHTSNNLKEICVSNILVAKRSGRSAYELVELGVNPKELEGVYSTEVLSELRRNLGVE